jgi:hypothetical protein
VVYPDSSALPSKSPRSSGPTSADANSLLIEIALCHVLEQLVRFLRNDIKGDFAPTSALYVVIMACQDQIQDLYRKLEKLQVRAGDKTVAGIFKRAI